MATDLRRILLFLLVFLPAGVSLSAQSRISWLEGSVTISRDSRETTASTGEEVFEGDLITTGPDSVAIIDLADADGNSRGTLKLREDTSMVLENLEGEISIDLRRGGLFSRIRKLISGNGRNYQVRTPNAVAAVRGTEFFVAYGRTVESEPDVWLCVNEGAVEVALEDSGDSVLVNEGEGINILGGSRITDPKYYPWTEDLNWNIDPSAGDVADTTNLDGAYSDPRAFDYD